MNDLRDLYQEVILDHSRQPRNFGALDRANRAARGDNPLCGDRLVLAARVRDGRVEDLAFEGSGCAISVASASLMTEAVKGHTVEEVEAMYQRFHRLLTSDAAAGEAGDLGKLEVFGGVREYPIRVKCATLAWHTLHAALERGAADDAVSVSTE
jgi:nitrogen fixation protein NifU and related proteins